MDATAKRVLPPAIMARVRACAILFLDSARRARIAEIADGKGIEIGDAAIVYAIGALKAAKRRGTARTYREALDLLEAEQVGDRGSRIARSISADKTAREVARINRINAGDSCTIDGVRYVHDYDIAHREYGYTTEGEYTYRDVDSVAHFADAPGPDKPDTGRSVGKVLGTLYTDWEARERNFDPALVMLDRDMQDRYRQVERNLQLFFREYQSRLSKTSKARLIEIAESDIGPGYMASAAGYSDPQAKRIAKAARYLYDNFPHKDGISCREFIRLVRKYVTV